MSTETMTPAAPARKLRATRKAKAALAAALTPATQPIAVTAAPFDLLPADESEKAEREIDQMLGRADARKNANVAASRYSRLAECESKAAGAAGRSAEVRGDEQHPLAAPAAASLPTPQLAAADGPDDDDVSAAEEGAFQLFCSIGTLADGFPRSVRKTEDGGWQLAGVLTDTLDALCAAYERKWERADRASDKALRALHDAERASQQGEIDGQQLMKAEDDAVGANDRAQFFFGIYNAARRAYELMTGGMWQGRSGLSPERAMMLGLANQRLSRVHHYQPPRPSACQRVIVMGGGGDCPQIADALAKVIAKYPALTLYTGDRQDGIEHQVARFAVEHRVQVIRFSLDREQDGRGAVFRRNERMLEAAKAHALVVAGPTSHGPTAELVKRAAAAGIKVWDLRHEPAIAG